MMDFITIPLVVGIISFGIYSLFELFVRRKERLAIIDKLGDKLMDAPIEGKLILPFQNTRISFNALKTGCFLCGIGLGLLVGFLINANTSNFIQNLDNWRIRETMSIVYGSSVLVFGGISLIIAFVIELFLSRKNK